MENRRGEVSEHESACARVAAQFPQAGAIYVGANSPRPILPRLRTVHGSNEPILDIGCGLGLLAFYLRERGCRQPILGLDVDLRKTRKGSRIASRYRDVDLRCQDIQGSIPAFSGNIALFDVLHYLPLTGQTALLSHLAECVAPGGLLVIRDCLRDNSPRFWMTWVAEKFGQAISWNLNTSLHFPSRERIAEAFNENEFKREAGRSGFLPFKQSLFIFRRVSS